MFINNALANATESMVQNPNIGATIFQFAAIFFILAHIFKIVLRRLINQLQISQ